ncbi:WD40-repeat-containing domain protein [Mycena rosella]|uniref:WD40-repeat-containing domain protein n=1 Tax=Mycena rosella TaxID=1033263 RepID=A0AAD7B1Z1_MYCRO|nr:WD40-repeat-containing domain protein [Mycena rosella]
MTSPSIPVFQQAKSLKSHTDNINVITFSDDGKYLASGDDGYICIFNTQSWELFRKYRTASPVHVIAWHPKDSKIITAGLKNGVLNTIQIKNNVKWEHSVHGVIHCASFQPAGKLLAIGFNNQVLLSNAATWSDEKYITPPSDFQGQEDIICSVYFHSKENIIIATYLYNGIIAYDTELGNQWWHIKTQGLCGDSALSATSRLLATTNLVGGIDWYDTSNRRITYTTPYTISAEANVPLPVAFIGTNIIAVGSAAGKVTIFKSSNSQALQNLDHHDDMVQALAHFHNTQKKTHILVTGTSEQYEECALTVWISVTNSTLQVRS